MTQPQDINYGQSYTVKWSGTSSVRNDPDAPESGFTFIIPSQETPTSALVCARVLTPKQAEGMDPYYISQNGPLDAGSESLYPAHQARVWSQESAKAGMIKSTWPRNGVMTYTGTPLTVKYGEGIYALKCSYTSSGWSNPPTAWQALLHVKPSIVVMSLDISHAELKFYFYIPIFEQFCTLFLSKLRAELTF